MDKERPLSQKEASIFLNGKKSRCSEGNCVFQSRIFYREGQEVYRTDCLTCNKEVTDVRVVFETKEENAKQLQS